MMSHCSILESMDDAHNSRVSETLIWTGSAYSAPLGSNGTSCALVESARIIATEKMNMKHIAVLTAILLVSPCVRAAGAPVFLPAGGANLDQAAFSQWVDGKEMPIAEDGPYSVMWTTQKRPDWRGVKFGEGRAVGMRYLRIAFTEPITVGSVLVRGGGSLSVLKPEAAYPGDLADDSQWMAADRLLDGKPSRKEVGREDYAFWILPAEMQTRAMRFSHLPSPGDPEMAGWLGGVWVNEQRLGNVAPQALAQSVAREDVSAKLIDESNNRTWGTWSNGEQGAALPVSPEHPEIITLTWPKPVKLSGLCLLWTGLSSVEVDAFTGGASENVREAADSRWQRAGSRSGMDALYPMALGPNWVPFEKQVETRALRLHIVAGAKSRHPHLQDKVKGGRRVWLGELMAVAPLASDAILIRQRNLALKKKG